MRVSLKPVADVGHKGQDDESGDRVANKRGDHQNEAGENKQDPVQAHLLNRLSNSLGHGVQETRRVDRLAERETARGQNDDGPREVVEVLLGQNAHTEEENDGDDGNDAHVSKDVFKLMRGAPQTDSGNAHNSDEPLHTREAVLNGADGHNGCPLARLETHQEKSPDHDQGNDAHGDDDEEPLTPRRRGLHDTDCNDVLGRCNRRQHSSDIGSERDAHDDGFGHVGSSRQVAKHGLHRIVSFLLIRMESTG